MMRENPLAASGKLSLSNAKRALWSSRLAMSCDLVFVVCVHRKSAAATTMADPIHDEAVRWVLAHSTSRLETCAFPATGGVVAVAGVAFGLGVPRVTVAIASRRCPQVNSHAPGVTRTPGQRFRKPLLYPPELQGQVRGVSGEMYVS